MNASPRIWFDDNGRPNVPSMTAARRTAWVGEDGIGRCADCVFDKVSAGRGWDARWNVAKAFATFGDFAPCDDDFCSDCDADIPAVPANA